MDLRQALPNAFGFGFTVDNVNEALVFGLDLIKERGEPVTRNGVRFWEVPGPVSIVYRTPMRRVLFDPVRDINPFAALFGSLWMLGGGRGDWLHRALTGAPLRSMHEFYAATGHRLQGMVEDGPSMQPVHQIQNVIQRLRTNPETRYALMGVWSPYIDQDGPEHDTPDHSTIAFNAHKGFLHMTVCSHAADAVRKVLGMDPVRFSMLHELVAVGAGLEVGYMTHQASTFFTELEDPFWQKYVEGEHTRSDVQNPYMFSEFQPWPLAVSAHEALRFLGDCDTFVSHVQESELHSATNMELVTPFFTDVVRPMMRGFTLYKVGLHMDAVNTLATVASDDWNAACIGWVMRRRDEAQKGDI